MQFESLKVFCDVARQQSMSQAASANEITQSAASQLVRQLEKRLGVQLVNRSTRPLQLTEVGHTYYEGCKDLVDRYLELEASIRKAQSQLSATVEVAAIYSVGLGNISQLIEQFMASQPGVKVHVEYLYPDRVYEKVLAGTADFGLVSFPKAQRELIALPWREEDMVVACAPGHALADQRAIKPSQLEGLRYVGFDRGLVIRRHIDRFLREQGVTVDIALEFDNIESIKKAVEENAGVSLLPEPTLRREVESGTIRALPLIGCRLIRPLGIIHRRNRTLSANAVRFMALLRQGSTSSPNGDHRRNGAAIDNKRRLSQSAADRPKR